MFGCIAYAIVPDEQSGKLDVKGTKYIFLGYCKGTKDYRLICLQIRKIQDVVFMEDDMSVGNVLKMHPSVRNEGLAAAVVDESFKSSSCDDSEEREE